MNTMPLMEDVPPSIMPRGTSIRRPPEPSSGSDVKHQLTAGLLINLETPAGTRDQKKSLPSVPASSNSTLYWPLSLNRAASVAPEEPAPMTMKSCIGVDMRSWLPRTCSPSMDVASAEDKIKDTRGAAR